MKADASSFITGQIARFAERSPDASALVDIDQHRVLTFQQLEQRFVQARRALRQLGCLKRRVVVLPAENSIEKIIHWLAVWSLGGVVMNLDSRHVPARLQQALLDRIQPDVLFHDPAHGRRPAALSAPSWSLLDPAQWRPLPPRSSCCLPPGTVLINTTTGTSGSPKLVYHGFPALLHHGRTSIRFLDLEAQEPCLEARSFNWFSAQILSLMPFLLLGTQLHIASYFSADKFHGWLEQYPIRFASTVPTILNSLLQSAPAHPDPARGLTRLSCSSAALSASVWQRVEQRFGIPVINLYGSSEAGWICGADQHNRQIGSVGFAAPGVRLERVACPDGLATASSPGQLRIHAEHLALAVQSLDQSAPQPLDGRLMIADQVRINEDGRVFLFGRTDDIINRSGIKIHPAVIEESIVRHPLVRQAVVFGVDHAETGQAVACAVVGDPRLDLAALQDYVARQCGLPASHQPLHWWMVEEVPYVGNGKISRQALAQRFHARLS